MYGIASVAAGILELVWGEFDPGHQPLQAWGDHIPGVTIFWCIAALWLIAGSAAILWRRSARFGAAALCIFTASSSYSLYPASIRRRISLDIDPLSTSAFWAPAAQVRRIFPQCRPGTSQDPAFPQRKGRVMLKLPLLGFA